MKTCVRCQKLQDISEFISQTKKVLKTCQTCRNYTNNNRKICEHGKCKYQCKDCNGSNICEHDKQRNSCKECHGVSICEHSRVRNTCKECNGSSICEHSRLRSICKECRGASICEHSRVRSRCKDCHGSFICKHSKERNTCKICDPAGHLSRVCRTRIHDALKSNKELHTQEYIGCSIEVFKQHIESQFKDDMTWKNYGSLWHIDHKIPLKYGNPTIEEVINRLHYTNTQPMYASENIAKGNRYISI